MNDQVFIQPHLALEDWAATEQDYEGAVLHTLIQAQLVQNLAEIETLLENPPIKSDERNFTVFHGKKESDFNAPLPKSSGIQKSFSFIPYLRAYTKSAWVKFEFPLNKVLYKLSDYLAK